MLFLVTAEIRDAIVGEAVRRLRQDVGTAVERVMGSGKVQAGGVVSGKRKLFFVLEADSAEELQELLGSELTDNANCDVLPILPFESLQKFFMEHPV